MSYRTKNGVCSSFEKTKGRWDGRAGPKTEKRRAGTLKQEQHQKNAARQAAKQHVELDAKRRNVIPDKKRKTGL
jgi:hypothetical protein